MVTHEPWLEFPLQDRLQRGLVKSRIGGLKNSGIFDIASGRDQKTNGDLSVEAGLPLGKRVDRLFAVSAPWEEW